LLPSSLSWKVASDAQPQLEPIKKEFGTTAYNEAVKSIKLFLCAYFDTVAHCDRKLGKTINPVGSTEDNGKLLKMRWALPGMGRSAGLRLGIAVWCEDRLVHLRSAVYRTKLKK